jgi:flagellar P-ring protein FlgI
MKKNIVICTLFLLSLLLPQMGETARLKDIININGVRNNPLIGFGLVVGLAGTGDSKLQITSQSTKMMLQRMGITSSGRDKIKNVAAVMVTATLPPFALQGTTLDATIASLGDAKSLKDGILIMTPLKGPDGKIYAVAQGSISVGGGFSAGGNNAKVAKGHNTVAKIVGGAIVEKEVIFDIGKERQLVLSLKNRDFTTSVRIANNINDQFGVPIARSHDSATVKVNVPKR